MMIEAQKTWRASQELQDVQAVGDDKPPLITNDHLTSLQPLSTEVKHPYLLIIQAGALREPIELTLACSLQHELHHTSGSFDPHSPQGAF